MRLLLAKSRPLILDPLMGHPESSRHITNLNLRGTIKELAQLGGFVGNRLIVGQSQEHMLPRVAVCA